jgi:hypothetical protein
MTKTDNRSGYTDVPREFFYAKFGPNSPIPAKYRVLQYIECCVLESGFAGVEPISISSESIIRATGIPRERFISIIKDLEKMKLIEVTRVGKTLHIALYAIPGLKK